MFTRGIITAAALLFFLAAAGCAGEKAPERRIIEVQMFSGPEYNAMVPTARYWNEHYAEKTAITVRVTELERVGYFGKLETQLVAGLSSPDIVHPYSLHLGRLRPYLEPLNAYLEREDIMSAPDGTRLSLEVMLEPALKTVASPDGRIYMVPKDMSEVILYYRKDLIPEPPETWDDYIDLAKRFTRSINPESPTEYGTIMQGKYEMWTFCAALENIWSYGGNIFVPGTDTLALGDEATVRGLEVYEKLQATGVFPPEAVDAEHPEVAAVITEGKVAMAMQWSAFYVEALTDKEKCPVVYGKFDIAPPPGVRQPDGTIKRDMYMQTICLAINKNSEKKVAAARFLAWATLGEGAVIYAKAGGSSPVKTVWAAEDVTMPYIKLHPWVKAYGRAVPMHKYITDIMMMGSGWVQKVVAGHVSAADAAKGLKKEVSDYLSGQGPFGRKSRR